LKNILSRARIAIAKIVENHPDAVPMAASAVRCIMTVTQGTIGIGRPDVVGVCAAISLTVDYLALRLTQ